jgi:hypothetical protein
LCHIMRMVCAAARIEAPVPQFLVSSLVTVIIELPQILSFVYYEHVSHFQE